jgi:hypothetical protein
MITGIPGITEFRAIPGHKGYSVTCDGRVWSHKSNGWLKLSVKPNGYRYAATTVSGKRVNIYVHRAVALAWIGPQPKGLEACHGDGDKSNNHVSNLRWDTHRSNMRDAATHGAHANRPAKVKPHDVADIRARLRAGETQSSVAASYGVTQSYISKLKDSP